MSARALHDWAIALAASLELGILLLYFLHVIRETAAIAAGFAVGAVFVTALLLRPGLEHEDQSERSNGPG